MLAFLDTEFTDLVIEPRLLSVGIVTDDRNDREFYAEVTDPDRLHATCWFGLATVLPQFGKLPHAASTYAQLGVRLSEYFGHLTSGLKADAFIALAYGYPLDWELVDRAITDAAVPSWAATRRRIRPVNVYPLTGFGSGKRAADTYLKSQELAPVSHHHALCDARALRLAYEAATQAHDGPVPPDAQAQETTVAVACRGTPR